MSNGRRRVFGSAHLQRACRLTMTDSFRIRLDMPHAQAEGYKACKDGVDTMTCPYKRSDPKHSEWKDGFARAERDNEKEKEKHFR